MKTHILAVLLFSITSIQISAQTTVDDIRNKIDSAFMNLDQQYITTGILIDKTAQFFDLNAFDCANDSIIDFTRWKAYYRMIELSSFNQTNFIGYDSIADIVGKNFQPAMFPHRASRFLKT